MVYIKFILYQLFSDKCDLKLEMEDDDDNIRLYWVTEKGCDVINKDLYVTYQRINTEICDVEDDPRDLSPFQVHLNDPEDSYYSYNSYTHDIYLSKETDLNLYDNSTYQFTLQSQQWQPGNRVNKGSQPGVIFNTSKGKYEIILCFYGILHPWTLF